MGNWLIWLAMGVTGTLFMMSKTEISAIWQTPWLSASQLFSLLGAVLMAISFILGSRAKLLETIFDGVDKVMKVHHIVGGISFLIIINHPLFLAINVLPNYQLAAKYIWLSPTVSYNLGVGALYVMILTLILTFLVKLPYDIWLKTHDFMGAVLLLAALHIYTISSDVSRFPPLRVWMFGWLGLGLFAFVYKVFLYSSLGPKYRYRVKETKRLGDILEIYLSPVGEKLKFKAGQFVFANYEMEELGEKHPFTVSSSPEDEVIRLSVKALGDYTLKLKKLKNGTMTNVWGPYGRFYRGFDGKQEVVMLAGGIGITPFLSMLNHELRQPQPRKISLFYGVNSAEEAVYDGELGMMEENLPNFFYNRHFGGDKPRISVNVLLDKLGGVLQDKMYFICGPPVMMESLERQLKDNGVRGKNIILEDFAFK